LCIYTHQFYLLKDLAEKMSPDLRENEQISSLKMFSPDFREHKSRNSPLDLREHDFVSYMHPPGETFFLRRPEMSQTRTVWSREADTMRSSDAWNWAHITKWLWPARTLKYMFMFYILAFIVILFLFH